MRAQVEAMVEAGAPMPPRLRPRPPCGGHSAGSARPIRAGAFDIRSLGRPAAGEGNCGLRTLPTYNTLPSPRSQYVLWSPYVTGHAPGVQYYQVICLLIGWGMSQTPKIEIRPFLSVFTLLERSREVQLDGCY